MTSAGPKEADQAKPVKEAAASGSHMQAEKSAGVTEGRPGGRGFRRRGCYNCGQSGHLAKECPNPKTTEKICFNCSQSGHIARDCPAEKRPREEPVCYTCNATGHIARNCPTAKPAQKAVRPEKPKRADGEERKTEGRPLRRGGRRPPKCYNCGRIGHISKTCPNPSSAGDAKVCYNCNQSGHISRDCPSERQPLSKSAQTCFNCGEAGHVSRACPKKQKAVTCYNCNEEGHIARDCPQQRKERDLSSVECHNCHTKGHLARDCPTSATKRV